MSTTDETTSPNVAVEFPALRRQLAFGVEYTSGYLIDAATNGRTVEGVDLAATNVTGTAVTDSSASGPRLSLRC